MEAMALESLVASVWRLEGFLAVVRHPVRVNRGYSDVDVIGVRSDGAVRIAECKARGPARRVNVDDGEGWSQWWDDSLDNLGRLWATRPAWLPKIGDVSSLEFHLVGNVWFRTPSSKARAESRLTRAARAHLPRALRRTARAFVKPSIELVINAVAMVRDEILTGRGKRYGDPLLDALRELVRYARPRPAGGGQGLGTTITAAVQAELRRALFDRPA